MWCGSIAKLSSVCGEKGLMMWKEEDGTQDKAREEKERKGKKAGPNQKKSQGCMRDVSS